MLYSYIEPIASSDFLCYLCLSDEWIKNEMGLPLNVKTQILV